MPNPHATFATSIRFDPPIGDRRPDEAIRAPGGLALVLDDTTRVRIDPDDRRSSGFVSVLEDLARRRRPAYVEVNPETGTIALLLIPRPAWVVSVSAGAENTLEVELHPSHARHFLRMSEEDSDVLERRLRDALEAKRPVLVTEGHRGGIIDVRDLAPDPESPLPPFPEPGGPSPPQTTRQTRRGRFYTLWKWFWIPAWLSQCPSIATVQQVFDQIAAKSCNPTSPTDVWTLGGPCIPFLYPDDGCWARAHEMCRLLLQKGYSPRKLWISGPLHVDTPNHPDCFVEWTKYHVAPILCVRGPKLFESQMMVIDPSLFKTPMTQAAWILEQNNPNATLTETDASQFFRNGGTDPNYTETAKYLHDYHVLLFNRANELGPPPYQCP
jgi:hypothetical protein